MNLGKIYASVVCASIVLCGTIGAMVVAPEELITVVCIDGSTMLAGSDFNDLKSISGLKDFLEVCNGSVSFPGLTKECFDTAIKNLGVITHGGKPLSDLLVSLYVNDKSKDFCALLTVADYLDIAVVKKASDSFLALKIPEIVALLNPGQRVRGARFLEDLTKLPFDVYDFSKCTCNRNFLFYALIDGHVSTVQRLIEKGLQRDEQSVYYFGEGLSELGLEEMLGCLDPIVTHDLEALRKVYQKYLDDSRHRALSDFVQCGHLLGMKVIDDSMKEFYKLLIDQEKLVFFESLLKYQTSSNGYYNKLVLGNDGGFFVRYAASLKGKSAFVSALISAGIPNSSPDEKGVTPLIEAAKNGHRDTVEVLLRLRAGVDIADLSGHTPLMEAARNGHTHIVLLLMKEGASVGLKDSSGMTALEHAAMNNHNGAFTALVGTSDSRTMKFVCGEVLERQKKQTDDEARSEKKKQAGVPDEELAHKKNEKASWSTRQRLVMLGIGCGLSYLLYKRYTQRYQADNVPKSGTLEDINFSR